MTPEIQHLIDIALLMAQELQEFVDDAIEAVEGGHQEDPLQATQALLKDWEEAYATADLSEEDHFLDARAAAGHPIYAVGHFVEVEPGEFREYIGDCVIDGPYNVEVVDGQ
jgi:hypothetical protein